MSCLLFARWKQTVGCNSDVFPTGSLTRYPSDTSSYSHSLFPTGSIFYRVIYISFFFFFRLCKERTVDNKQGAFSTGSLFRGDTHIRVSLLFLTRHQQRGKGNHILCVFSWSAKHSWWRRMFEFI